MRRAKKQGEVSKEADTAAFRAPGSSCCQEPARSQTRVVGGSFTPWPCWRTSLCARGTQPAIRNDLGGFLTYMRLSIILQRSRVLSVSCAQPLFRTISKMARISRPADCRNREQLSARGWDHPSDISSFLPIFLPSHTTV